MERFHQARYEEVTAGAGYESLDNYLYLDTMGQTCFIKPANHDQKKSKKFKKQIGRAENLTYDPDEDCLPASRAAGCRCAGSAVNGKMDNWFPTPGIAVKTASAVPAGHSAAAPGMQTGQRRSCFRKPSGRNAPRPPSIFPQTEGYPRQGQCANRAISTRSGLQPEKAVEEAGTRQAASLCI